MVDANVSLNYWCEGILLLSIILIGSGANLLSVVILRNRELCLTQNFSQMLQSLAFYDVGYLVLNLPAFVVPALIAKDSSEVIIKLWPFFYPLLHVCLAGSSYTTIGLAIERLNAIKVRNTASRCQTYPTVHVIWVILVFCVALNIPRFFDITFGYKTYSFVQRINFTGDPIIDHQIVKVQKPSLVKTSLFTKNYFLYYNQLLHFVVFLAVPLVSLIILNCMIWIRLKAYKGLANRLGKQQRKTVRATVSLIGIVAIFIVCNSVRLVVNGYQVAEVLRTDQMIETWPVWVEHLTVVSHLLLALNASVNLVLYCFCDKHFFVITQKTLKRWFVWPFTMRKEMTRGDSLTEMAKHDGAAPAQTVTTEL